MQSKVVGILALQGAFARHGSVLDCLGVINKEVKTSNDLNDISALIIPGGESTTIAKQMNEDSLFHDIKAFGRDNPLFGTCAGAILMAKKVVKNPFESFAFMDISIQRNAYGPQTESFYTHLDIPSTSPNKIPAFFIRAPVVIDYGPNVRVLAHLEQKPVLLQEDKHLVATFHPELTTDLSVHQYFINLISYDN